MIIPFDRHHGGAVAQHVPGEFHNHAAAGVWYNLDNALASNRN